MFSSSRRIDELRLLLRKGVIGEQLVAGGVAQLVVNSYDAATASGSCNGRATDIRAAIEPGCNGRGIKRLKNNGSRPGSGNTWDVDRRGLVAAVPTGGSNVRRELDPHVGRCRSGVLDLHSGVVTTVAGIDQRHLDRARGRCRVDAFVSRGEWSTQLVHDSGQWLAAANPCSADILAVLNSLIAAGAVVLNKGSRSARSNAWECPVRGASGRARVGALDRVRRELNRDVSGGAAGILHANAGEEAAVVRHNQWQEDIVRAGYEAIVGQELTAVAVRVICRRTTEFLVDDRDHRNTVSAANASRTDERRGHVSLLVLAQRCRSTNWDRRRLGRARCAGAARRVGYGDISRACTGVLDRYE